MADAKETNEKTSAGGKKKPPMIVIAAVVLVAAAAGLLWGKQVLAKGSHGPAKPQPGPIMPLDDFLVNLADPGGDHFLKVTVNLELTKASGQTPDSLKDQIPQIRDAVLTALCGETRADVAPLSGREALKTSIEKAVNASLGADDVEKVYFSDFVTQ